MAAPVEVLAIIPARGGSKGIPRKNVQVLVGKPLIAHTIECAREAGRVTRVVVSTDDPEIAHIAERSGAEVVWRPAAISGDTASSESALLHVLDTLYEAEHYRPELTCFLQCTSPLTLPEDIDGTIQTLLTNRADTCLAVTPFHFFLWQQDASGDMTGINHDKRMRLLRQQQTPQYQEAGAVYVMRTEGFLETKHRFFGTTSTYVMPQERCFEIDEPIDFEIASMLMQTRHRALKRQLLPDPIGAVVLDFDGVFTDNRVITFQDGREAVVCSRSDGWGFTQLRRLGLPVLVLSTEVNSIVQVRCDKLGLPSIQGVDDKLSVLEKWLSERDLDMSTVVYLGNDLNDLDCLQAVGCSVVVQDAHHRVKPVAKIILENNGGDGAIRELVELISQRIKSKEMDE